MLGLWESLTLCHPALSLQSPLLLALARYLLWSVIPGRGTGGICQCRHVKLSRFYIRTNSELCNLPQSPVAEQVLWQVRLCPAHTAQPENVGCIFCSGGIFHP